MTRNPNALALAMRDPALAALVGAIPGADFGGEIDYGAGAYGGQGSSDDFGADYGFHGYSPTFGLDLGFPGGGGSSLASQFHLPTLQAAMHAIQTGTALTSPAGQAALAAASPMAASPANNPAMAAAWNALCATQACVAAQQNATKARHRLIEPNGDSTLNVERFAFYINQDLTIGTAGAIDSNNNPDTNIRPQRVTMNAPTVSFALIDNLKMANVSVLIGGSADAFEYNANGVGQHLDVPTLTPANRARVSGTYTGALGGFTSGDTFVFTVGLKGPATMTP